MKTTARRATLPLLLITLSGSAGASWLDGVGGFFSDLGNDVKGFFDREPAEEQAAAPQVEAAPAPAPAPRPSQGGTSDHQLHGNWKLVGADDRQPLGSLTADAKYFSINVSEPPIDMRIAYTQASNGDFICTVLDKQVITLEGRFEHSDKIDLNILVKDIGKPAVKTYNLLATRTD